MLRLSTIIGAVALGVVLQGCDESEDRSCDLSESTQNACKDCVNKYCSPVKNADECTIPEDSEQIKDAVLEKCGGDTADYSVIYLGSYPEEYNGQPHSESEE